MKTIAASATASILLSAIALAEDQQPAPAKTPKPPTATRERPRILTLETPATPGAPKPANPAGGPANPPPQLAPADPLIITPALPGGSLVPPHYVENTGPMITLNDKNAPLAPGIYVASPYTGIVVVPGPSDPGIFKPEPPNRNKMPMVVPELKLTPKAK